MLVISATVYPNETFIGFAEYIHDTQSSTMNQNDIGDTQSGVWWMMDNKAVKIERVKAKAVLINCASREILRCRLTEYTTEQSPASSITHSFLQQLNVIGENLHVCFSTNTTTKLRNRFASTCHLRKTYLQRI